MRAVLGIATAPASSEYSAFRLSSILASACVHLDRAHIQTR